MFTPKRRLSLPGNKRKRQSRAASLAQQPRGRQALLGVVAVLALVYWLTRSGHERKRIYKGDHTVYARDFSTGKGGVWDSGRGKDGDVVLVLCPMKNSIEHIWHFFQLLDSLTYPKHLLQLGVLVSDSSDRTYERALELADERQYKRGKSARWSKMTVVNKDFAGPNDVLGDGGTNVGKARHAYDVQIERRRRLAKSRSWLLTSVLGVEPDWVIWIDVDVVELPKDLIQTLIARGNAERADVVVPQCAWKTYNEQGSYDLNNWIETEASRAHKLTIPENMVLIEGYPEYPTLRDNLAYYFPPNATTPKTLTLDGVGGCTTLVKADIHRMGAIFPTWPVDHQLETEGFAQMAKKLGARLIGLTDVMVYHGLYG